MSAALSLTIDKGSPVPIYHQLAQALETAIRTGTLAPGDRIERVADLAARLRISRPTVSHALNQLVDAGLLVRVRGEGVHVAATDPPAPSRRPHAPLLRNRRPVAPPEDSGAGDRRRRRAPTAMTP